MDVCMSIARGGQGVYQTFNDFLKTQQKFRVLKKQKIA